MTIDRDSLPIYDPPRWWRGSLHGHSLWSDGDDFPEMVAAWYKSQGYHFLSLTEHDRLQEGSFWRDVDSEKIELAIDKYGAMFGDDWVEQRTVAGQTQVRLKPREEYRPLLEEAGRFLLVQGEEISVWAGEQPHWLNANNIEQAIPPQRAQSSIEVIKQTVEAVRAHARETGRRVMLHLNHPNYRWNALAEEMFQVEALEFMEVHTALNSTWSYGDELHVGAERIWDIVLAMRLGVLGKGIVYGLVTDDAHHYHQPGDSAAPGRAWVMVRSRTLTPDALVGAMARGDFYGSSGVALKDIRADGSGLTLKIDGEEGVAYTTHFIGTRRGFDQTATPVIDDEGNPVRTTQRYSEQIGELLAEVSGLQPSYRFTGDELYVRAVVTSSRPHPNPTVPGDVEKAWIQPGCPA